ELSCGADENFVRIRRHATRQRAGEDHGLAATRLQLCNQCLPLRARQDWPEWIEAHLATGARGDDHVHARRLFEWHDVRAHFGCSEITGEFLASVATERYQQFGLGAQMPEPARDIRTFAAGPATLAQNVVLLLPLDALDFPLA